jgi:hypothetical protein
MSNNKADLYQPIFAAANGLPPLVIRAVVTKQSPEMLGGVPSTSQKVENYVMISSLPEELQERVKLAIQALISAR